MRAPLANIGHGHVYPRADGERARCGGPRLCPSCAKDLARKTEEAETHDPDTLLKVREALGEYLPTEEKVTDCINAMQNKGILFRERV